MQLTVPQQQISADKNRFRVIAAGRRFGKTFLAINELAKFSRFPNQKCLYMATSYRQAKTVIWTDLLDMLYSRNWIKKVNQSELMVTLVNGSTITLRSSENKDSLRGGKYNFIALDEFADMDPDTWFTVLRPTLSDTLGHAMFIGSPKGRNHFWDLWTQAGVTDDWSSYQYTTIEGGNVVSEEIEAARRDLDTRQFAQEYEAQFITYESVIFYGFTEHNVIADKNTDASMPLHIGMDFNISPMSAVIGHKKGDKLHIFDEIEIYGSDTYEMVKEIKHRYPNAVYNVYPDATGRAGSTNSVVSNHVILQNNGFKVYTDLTNPSVADSINAVNSLFRNSSGEIRLTIDPKCSRLRECLIKHSYKENSRVPDKNSGYDHLTDALRYVVYKLFPIKQHISSGIKPQRNIGQIRNNRI
tara:strand:- start:2024 stop:3262 length:1239 start_codon:yes stop_codon:yes gene_type:complete